MGFYQDGGFIRDRITFICQCYLHVSQSPKDHTPLKLKANWFQLAKSLL